MELIVKCMEAVVHTVGVVLSVVLRNVWRLYLNVWRLY